MGHRILVTGASGRVGQELVRNLKQQGVEFTAASLGQHEYPTDIRSLQLDYGHPGLLETAFEGKTSLFVVIPWHPQMKDYARNIAMAARQAGVRHLVRLGLMGADPQAHYVLHCLQGEMDEILRDSGVNTTLICANLFMQNYINFYGEALRRGALYLPEGEGRISFVDVRDIASAACRILQNPQEHQNQTYTLTGERAISNAEALSLISRAAQRRISYVPITEERARELLARESHSNWEVEMWMSLHRAVREGAMSMVTQAVSALSGWAPRKFEDFCVEQGAIWKKPEARSLEL